MKAITIIVNDHDSLRKRMLYAWELIKKGLAGGPVVITLSRLRKSRDQEAKYHAMIGDIAKTVDIDGKTYGLEEWKALLVDSYEQELIAGGDCLRHPSKVVLSLDGLRAVSIRASTKEFIKKEASGFIEYLYMVGAEYGAVFSEKSLEYYMECVDDMNLKSGQDHE